MGSTKRFFESDCQYVLVAEDRLTTSDVRKENFKGELMKEDQMIKVVSVIIGMDVLSGIVRLDIGYMLVTLSSL
jgi:hypothetical protein